MDARAIFRAGNDHIAAIARRAPGTPASFICECDDESCLEPVPLTAAEYDSVRASEGRYLVARGHEQGDNLVERFEGYALVEPGALGRIRS